MLDRGWNQSELARRADMGRDNVSGYINGKNLPGPKHLKALANALGVSPDELIKEYILSGLSMESPILEIKADPNDANMAHVRIIQAMPMRVALNIAELITKESNNKS